VERDRPPGLRVHWTEGAGRAFREIDLERALMPARRRTLRSRPAEEWLIGGPLDELNDRLAQIRIGNIRVGAQQAIRIRLRHRGEGRLESLHRDLLDRFAPIEERADRHVEHACDLGQAAGADPVHSLLVFLHLLKRHADALGEFALRQAGGETLDANSLPNLDVDQIRLFRSHGAVTPSRTAASPTRQRGVASMPAPRCRFDGKNILRMARRVTTLAPRAVAARLDRDALDQFDDRTTQLAVGESRIGLQQTERVRVRDQRERGLDARHRYFFDAVAAFEEGVDRDVENARDLRETTCADAVRSLLIFLHLLERHADALAELGLRQSGGKALDLDALSNLDINGIGFSRGHGSLRLGALRPSRVASSDTLPS